MARIQLPEGDIPESYKILQVQPAMGNAMAAVTDWRSTDLLNEKEKLAVEFTELYVKDHLSIDDTMFERLKVYFSDVEIFEIIYTIGALVANGRLMQVLQLEQQCKI